jgi:PhzF family phenazine biosynthesis protein
VRREGARGAEWSLRWFTPAAEVELCGHATLASAHILWTEEIAPAREPIRFQTRCRGILTCTRAAVEGEEGIEMDFPAERSTPAEPPQGLVDALGVRPQRIERSRYDWLVEAAGEAAVRSLRPDFAALRQVDARGIIVTSRSDPAHRGDYDFVSRFFAPRLRVDEDPVTGSAHCVLAPYWCSRLGRDALAGYQASRRGGRVAVRLNGDRVMLCGRAVTVVKGALMA